jgi:hypothetical protein
MAAAIGLEIGAATERAFDAQQKLSEARARRREIAQAQIARREQHGPACHAVAHVRRGRRRRRKIFSPG